MSSEIVDNLVLGKRMSEHFTDFVDEIAVVQKPVENWPKLFGQKSSKIIRDQFGSRDLVKVLVVHGGVGRTTLELLKNCKGLSIDHADADLSNLEVLKSLLKHSKVRWQQQVEGLITETREFDMGQPEVQLLTGNGNSVTFLENDFKQTPDVELNEYDVIVADFRYKDSGNDINRITKMLTSGGILILGTIDDVVGETNPGSRHSLPVLKKFYSKISQPGTHPIKLF